MVCPIKLDAKELKIKNEYLNDQQMVYPFGFDNYGEDYLLNYWLVNLCLCNSLLSFEY